MRFRLMMRFSLQLEHILTFATSVMGIGEPYRINKDSFSDAIFIDRQTS